jgi:hypothetical protein
MREAYLMARILNVLVFMRARVDRKTMILISCHWMKEKRGDYARAVLRIA